MNLESKRAVRKLRQKRDALQRLYLDQSLWPELSGRIEWTDLRGNLHRKIHFSICEIEDQIRDIARSH